MEGVWRMMMSCCYHTPGACRYAPELSHYMAEVPYHARQKLPYPPYCSNHTALLCRRMAEPRCDRLGIQRYIHGAWGNTPDEPHHIPIRLYHTP